MIIIWSCVVIVLVFDNDGTLKLVGIHSSVSVVVIVVGYDCGDI